MNKNQNRNIPFSAVADWIDFPAGEQKVEQ